MNVLMIYRFSAMNWLYDNTRCGLCQYFSVIKCKNIFGAMKGRELALEALSCGCYNAYRSYTAEG